ncbi:MAG: aminofutalosine synthase MqnE [Candidatus Saccharibacteria bacterium]
MNGELNRIIEKVHNHVRLDRQDGINLYKSFELLQMGRLARFKKYEKTQNKVFFNVNQHVNLTNVCVSRCTFCAFGKDKDDAQAYTMTVEDAVEYAKKGPADITELHIVSALHPDLPFSYYVEVIDRLRREFPGVHLQAFTAVEIEYFSRISGLSIYDVLKTLKDAGLGSMPGGGAEILSDRIRGLTCSKKANAKQWLEVMATAHSLGIRTNATMLYGHLETIEERIDHMIQLRELQDQTGGFQAFIPLKFHPENTELANIKQTSAFDDLRTISISRLMLDNFDHIKAFWIMLGIPIAQIALEFGADDLDGTVIEERITHAAGATTDVGITREDIIRLIHEAGYEAVERDTLYNIVARY